MKKFYHYLIVLILLFLSGVSCFADSKVFNTVLYTGNGGTQQINGVGFKPDLVWIKDRTVTRQHDIYDSVRGPFNRLYSNLTDAAANNTDGLQSFQSDGFTLGSSVHDNGSGEQYVAWCWKADLAGHINNDSGLSQTEKYSLESGLSIIKYTGNGVAGRTIKHSLGAVPKLMLVKNLNEAQNWGVYSAELGADKYLLLNATIASQSSTQVWNNTNPTSTTITFGGVDRNASGINYIAYIFSEIPGISKFGSYTGNGAASGPVIACGFKPSYVMIKRIDSGGDQWFVYDSKRGNGNRLWAESAGIEGTSANYVVDFTETGFQVKSTSGGLNGNGANYLYMAFRESNGPTINFSSDKQTIDLNVFNSVTLSWNVSGADSVSIDNGIGNVNATGSIAAPITGPTTFTLTAAASGYFYTKQIFVSVINGYDKIGKFTVDGKIGIGVLNPLNALEVNGIIKAKEVIVTTEGWADYALDQNYPLQDLGTVETYIRQHRHLPNVPSETDLKVGGLSISRMLELHMKKIEELTLYVIGQDKKITQLQKENIDLKNHLSEHDSDSGKQ